MKKIIYILVLILISLPVSAASSNKRDAIREMNESYRHHADVCNAITDNFSYDHQFSGYFRGKCLFYQSDRQRLITSIFPVTTKSEDGFREQLPILMANFVINANNRELENYKTIVTEYCKYNAYKFARKNPKACLPETIKSLFN